MTYDTPPGVPPKPPQAPSDPSRLLPIVGAALGLLGLIVSVAAWLRAAPSDAAAGPTFTEQQVADAQAAVCEAYEKGFRAIQTAVSKNPDNSTETFPSTLLNARIAETAVASYLFNSLGAHPAAPSDLRDLVNQLGGLYQSIVMIQLTDGTREDVGPIADKTREVTPKIDLICR